MIVKGTQRATGKGGSFEAPFLHLMEYRDGKVVRGEFEGDSAKALKALGQLPSEQSGGGAGPTFTELADPRPNSLRLGKPPEPGRS